MAFQSVLQKYRELSFSERDKGSRFERLMQAWLKTDPLYKDRLAEVWLWSEFPSRAEFGGKDTGIDLVALTITGEFWAVQCKCLDDGTYIDKPAVDSFLATSSKTFQNDQLQTTKFSGRLWISTTNKWGSEAENTIHHQSPPVQRVSLTDLEASPVDWAALEKGVHGEPARLEKKALRVHQQKALDACHQHFASADRGQLIMACGTGKTFTSLKIAEQETRGTGLVLFLVPSIALLGQTLREWSAEASEPLNAVCVCSDVEVSRKKTKNEDFGGFSIEDLALPASTDAPNIATQIRNLRQGQKEAGLTVVFSTYQSIEAVARAQTLLNRELAGSGIFDLVICDEAHRTTGVTLADEDESAFVKVHDNAFLPAKKRLYMTATPRLYNEETQKKAAEADVFLCSMDDVSLYGQEFYRIGFGEAVNNGLLADYKVLVLTLSEGQIPAALQQAIADARQEINTDDASKLIGCINALSKRMLLDAELLVESDPEPMRRAVAFCQSIKISKRITGVFNTQKDVYYQSLGADDRAELVTIEADHVDGTMGAATRDEKLSWLKSVPADAKDCRILTNVRCLSEGVDVPSLDAVLFLSARNSQIDVVQSVGRVMRTSPGKKYGYIIIPVVIPAHVSAEAALDDNERFKVVWTVLNALRAHDDRFNAMVNKLELNKKRPGGADGGGTVLVGGVPFNNVDWEAEAYSGSDRPAAEAFQREFALQFEQLQGVIYARMVKKVGDKRYWEQWAASVGAIAQRHIDRITKLIAKPGDPKAAFDHFLAGLHRTLNPAVTPAEAIEMLAQHIITKPVFEALFENYSFVKNNPVSVAMQRMVDLLEEQSLAKDHEVLQKFYDSVRLRASGIDNAEARQRIIVELYDKFFRTAFPLTVEKLGIVYTPVEVVDFIVNSVADVLKSEFGRTLSDENVHILDPFTGTGTFITRLLQSGHISPDALERKYLNELHANEIVLLAYYIASINIENVYHDLRRKHFTKTLEDPRETLQGSSGNLRGSPKDQFHSPESLRDASEALIESRERLFRSPEDLGHSRKSPDQSLEALRQTRESRDGPSESLGDTSYAPFPGICLTDTFQLYETQDNFQTDEFRENGDRIDAQRRVPLQVIFGNPPYSVGQKSANDNAQNRSYPKLERAIEANYAQGSSATLLNSLYDSYIKAFRWASDRLNAPQGGIVAFVSNAGWIDGNAMDGLRRSFEKEFNAIYVFNLRGNQRTSGELSRKEGGKIFGGGSRTPIAITVLVKKSVVNGKSVIRYHDIGDYLSREEKLAKIRALGSVAGIGMTWTELQPNEHSDWLNQRNDAFSGFIALGDKDDKTSKTFFLPVYSRGVATSRDSWCYNSKRIVVESNIRRSIDFYNEVVREFAIARESNPRIKAEEFIVYDPTKFTWDRAQKGDLKKGTPGDMEKGVAYTYRAQSLGLALYRPFFRQHGYLDREMNNTVYLLPMLFPNSQYRNLVICVPGTGSNKDQMPLVADSIPDLHLNGDTQAFPLYYYEKSESQQSSLFDEGGAEQYIRRDAVTDFIHSLAKDRYGPRLTKEDIFYYVYGFLHSPDYRTRYVADLKKMLPRLPLVGKSDDFWAFSKAGRALAELHLGYESVEPYPLTEVGSAANLRVEKMRWTSKTDKSKLIYNATLTLSGIPDRAHQYVVNGRSALDWLVDRYQVTVHPESQIKNDPNDWCDEVGDPRYIVDLVKRIVTVSLKTLDIVEALPKWAPDGEGALYQPEGDGGMVLEEGGE